MMLSGFTENRNSPFHFLVHQYINFLHTYTHTHEIIEKQTRSEHNSGIPLLRNPISYF